jgi:hypothetical protein
MAASRSPAVVTLYVWPRAVPQAAKDATRPNAAATVEILWIRTMVNFLP